MQRDLLCPPHRRFALLLPIATVALFGAAGCEPDPPLSIRYRLTKGSSQTCEKSDCGEIAVTCDAVLSIRIFDPRTPGESLAKVCKALYSPKDLCSMGGEHLPADLRLPVRRLAVQVALYNADDIDFIGSLPQCPDSQPFDANGFPAPSTLRPAVAGMGYYDPGATETVVELGCTDLGAVDTATCNNTGAIRVTASVQDFDSGAPVSDGLADTLALAVGEPVAKLEPFPTHKLLLGSMRSLQRVDEIRPAWLGEVTLRFASSACVEVYEDVAQSTKTITCKETGVDINTIDLPAVRLAKQTVDDVLTALQKASFPDEGLVVGKVIDRTGKPVKDVVVRSSSGSVQYLSATRDSLVSGATSENGIFISRDARYLTTWMANGTGGGFGGLVAGRVTIVLLQQMDNEP